MSLIPSIPALSLEEYHVDSFVTDAINNPSDSMGKLLDTVDGAIDRQSKQIDEMDAAYENLSGSVLGKLREQVGGVSAPNLASLREKLMDAAGTAAGGLVALLFNKAIDTAFTYASRHVESMANRILQSVSIYAEMFFRSDVLIQRACAAYLAEQIVADMRDIAAEMGGIEQVLVRMNALSKELAALEDLLTGIPPGGPEVFLKALLLVRRARSRIAEALITLEDTGVVSIGYITSARQAVKAAQEALPHKSLTQLDLDRLLSSLDILTDLQALIGSFSLRVNVIVERYVRIVAYAAMIRNLPDSLFGESRLLKSLSAEIGLKSVDGQLEKIEGRLDRYSDATSKPQEVYHRATKERMALEIPYLELLMMERLFYERSSSDDEFEALLEALNDPFFKGDPFEEFKRLIARFTAITSHSASVTDRMVKYSSDILFNFRGLRNGILSLAGEIEMLAPQGEAVDLTRSSINSLLRWTGIRNPMKVVATGMVVATLLSRQVSNLSATAALAKTASQNQSVYDISNAATEYFEASVSSLEARAVTEASNLALEPLAELRPWFRTVSDSMTRSRMTGAMLSDVRTEAMLGTDISQVILDVAPQFDEGRLRGLNVMKAQPYE